jgi:acetyl-CoA carboxylase carboxyl transferase subunit alpha
MLIERLLMAILQRNERIDYLPFESEVAEIAEKINELKENKSLNGPEIRKLQKQQAELISEIYSNLSPWQTIQVARHPQRPLLGDYLSMMITDFKELHGDRAFGDDRAIITGFGQIGRERVLIVGHNKGRDTKEKIECNFGCANPEGYRKAISKMKLAEKFGIPVVTLIDTPGAYPGIGAEERGQAQAIAYNLMEMSRLKVPILSIVIGEGGSGGALGIGVGDKLAMLEFSYYSVISPEGCAAILWRDGTKAAEAAEALKLTSKELLKLRVVDDVIAEPAGGAHRSLNETTYNLEIYITKTLNELKNIDVDTLLERRYNKITSIGSPVSLGV